VRVGDLCPRLLTNYLKEADRTAGASVLKADIYIPSFFGVGAFHPDRLVNDRSCMKIFPFLLLGLLAVSPLAAKPRIKEVKPLDDKTLETESVQQRNRGISESELKTFDIKCLDITVDSAKQAGLTVEVEWLGTQLKEPKKAHIWSSYKKWAVDPDAKGDVTERTPIVRFAKDAAEALQISDDAAMVYSYEGWVVYLINSKGQWIDRKASSPAVEKFLRDEKRKPEEKK
jgi:hypothetical protein